MVRPQGEYAGGIETPDLRVNEADYFGKPLASIHEPSRRDYGLLDSRRTDLYRVSYVYQQVFQNRDEYGGIQARARTFLHLDNGAVPTIMQRHVQRSAHRAARIFDSSIEEPIYGENGGYLSGFSGWEETEDHEGRSYQNWEVERVTGVDGGAAGVGAIDWSLEIYLDEKDDGGEFTGYATLSGLATGRSNPWRVDTERDQGRSPKHIQGTKWQIGWEQSRRGGDGEYYVRPQPGKQVSKRYGETAEYGEGAGHGKTVYVNGKPIADSTDGKARAWLSPEYGVGDGLTFGGNYSREGLVEESDDATYQALRKGGVLYQTGETTEGIYLATARAKPDGWQSADPDSIPVLMEVDEGAPATERHRLVPNDPEEPLEVYVASDDRIDKHLGYSTAPYQHHIRHDGWEWPGFRPVAEYGANLNRFHPEPRGDDVADPWTDDTQPTGLDDYTDDDEGDR